MSWRMGVGFIWHERGHELHCRSWWHKEGIISSLDHKLCIRNAFLSNFYRRQSSTGKAWEGSMWSLQGATWLLHRFRIMPGIVPPQSAT